MVAIYGFREQATEVAVERDEELLRALGKMLSEQLIYLSFYNIAMIIASKICKIDLRASGPCLTAASSLFKKARSLEM